MIDYLWCVRKDLFIYIYIWIFFFNYVILFIYLFFPFTHRDPWTNDVVFQRESRIVSENTHQPQGHSVVGGGISLESGLNSARRWFHIRARGRTRLRRPRVGFSSCGSSGSHSGSGSNSPWVSRVWGFVSHRMWNSTNRRRTREHCTNPGWVNSSYYYYYGDPHSSSEGDPNEIWCLKWKSVGRSTRFCREGRILFFPS